MRIASAMAVAAVILGLAANQALAQAWPSRQIRIVVPFAAGGAVDVTARIFAQRFQDALKVPVIVENRAGAGGNIGAETVAKAAPDGYTILLNTNGQAISPATYKSLPWSPADFAPVTQLLSTNLLLVARPDFPAKNLQEFIAYAKARPGALSFGSSGKGSGAQLASVLFLRAAGLDVQHVPYRGGSAAMQAVMAGDVAFAFATVNTASQLIREGQLRAHAVAADRRVGSLPDVPTLAERGLPGCELYEWNGLFAPAGTPPDIITRLHEAVRDALRDPAVQERFGQIGAETPGTSPEVFAGFLASQRETMARLVRDAGITLD